MASGGGGDGGEEEEEEDQAIESNVGSYCGSQWNELMKNCMTATRCPNGDECAEGEFCYRDFLCKPPPTPLPTTTTVATMASNKEPAMDGGGATGSTGNDGMSTSQGAQASDETCSLCGNSQLDWSQRVTFDDNDVSCGEFGWIFLSENVHEGSTRCLNFRAQYFGQCCYAKPLGNGCELCDGGGGGPRHEVQRGVNVEFDGNEVSCAELSDKVRSRFAPNDEQCTVTKDEHFDACCFQKCDICEGDSHLDGEATVLFSGEEVPCHDLDSRIIVEEGISAESPRCEMSRSFYAESCCIQPPAEPCNLCRSNTGQYFNMNSIVEVPYEGEVKTCLEVYHSLYAREEQSGEGCVEAQRALFDQCCTAIGGNAEPVDMPSSSPTQKPTPDFMSWYSSSSISPASSVTMSSGLFYSSVAAGLLIRWLEL
ncbi:hypothetical protein ACHAWF_004368 [Thalassiosira exigua]